MSALPTPGPVPRPRTPASPSEVGVGVGWAVLDLASPSWTLSGGRP